MSLTPYLSHLPTPCTASRTLCSQYKQLLAVSAVICSRGFHYAAPSVWNEIPFKMHNSPSLSSFKKHLNTLFHLCLPSVPPHHLLLLPTPHASHSALMVDTAGAISASVVLYCIVLLTAFSAFTLLVVQQEGHPACKNGGMVEVGTG